MRIAICDDNQVIAKQLNEICYSYFKDKMIRGTATVIRSEKELLDTHTLFDVVFLDIKLINLNGLQLASYIRKTNRKIKIIFVSSYVGYKSKVINIRPFGYIEKPFSSGDIYDLLDESLLYDKEQKKINHLKIKSKDGYQILDLSHVMYFFYEDRKVNFVYSNSMIYTSYGTINEFYLISKECGFLKVHQAYVVNYTYISAYKRYQIRLLNHEVIPIAQPQYRKFEKEFLQLITL